MRRWRPSLIIAVLSVAVTLPLHASAQTVRDGKMRILGHASIEVVPDFAMVRVGISNKAKTPTAALDHNSGIARKIIAFAKNFGVDEKDVRTDSVNLSPAFRQVRDANGTFRQEPDGYNASNAVRVKISELSRLGSFMRDVLDQGATNIGGVQFGVSKFEQVADDARAKAVENAFHQAEHLAQAAKVKLGAIDEIVHPPRVQFQYASGAGLADLPSRSPVRSAVPIEVGTVTVAAEVDMTWRIE